MTPKPYAKTSKTIGRRCLVGLIVLPALLCACSTAKNSSFAAAKHKSLSAVKHHPATGNSEALFSGNSDADAEDRLKNLPAKELVDKGRIHLAQGNLALAKLHFLLSIRKAPEELPTYVELARALEQEGNHGRAEKVYTEVLKKNPDYSPALIGQGRLKRMQNQPEEALTILMRVNGIDPTNVAGLNELAITLGALGEGNLAEKFYLAIVKLRPELAAAHNNLGFNYLLQENYPKALSAFQEAYSRNPRDKKILNNLAVAHALSGQKEKALELFERAQNKPAAYNNLGYLYLVQGKTEEAKAALNHALEINPVFYARASENLETIESSSPER